MAYQGKKIRNTITGQDILFLQTTTDSNGELLEMESTYQPHSKEPKPHYHPFQEELFHVVSGEINVRIDGLVKSLKAGEELFIPKKKVHSMWNASEFETVVNWKVRPAMITEYLLETATGLANDGKTNEVGIPSLFQSVLMINKFHRVFRIANPPFWVQRGVFFILSPLAKLLGYRATYHQYID